MSLFWPPTRRRRYFESESPLHPDLKIFSVCSRSECSMFVSIQFLGLAAADLPLKPSRWQVLQQCGAVIPPCFQAWRNRASSVSLSLCVFSVSVCVSLCGCGATSPRSVMALLNSGYVKSAPAKRQKNQGSPLAPHFEAVWQDAQCVEHGRRLWPISTSASFFFEFGQFRLRPISTSGIICHTPEPHVAFSPTFVHPLFPVFEPHIQKWVIFVRRRPCVCDTLRFESFPSPEKKIDFGTDSLLFPPRTTTIKLPECQERRGAKTKKSVFLRRRRGPKAGDAFTRTRLMPTFGVSSALSAEHCGPQVGNVQQKSLLLSCLYVP